MTGRAEHKGVVERGAEPAVAPMVREDWLLADTSEPDHSRPAPSATGRVEAVLQAALPAGIAALPPAERREQLRILEAVLFATSVALDEKTLARNLTAADDVPALLIELQGQYAGRGINLVRVAGKWAFRTASDLSYLLERHAIEERKLSKAALETLAIVAYHQPVTRAEIEEIRGVSTSKGTLDVLLETGWLRMRGRRRAPGRPVTYGTTDGFLEHFGFESLKDLPGLAELKGAGLLDANLPPDFQMPDPGDLPAGAFALMPGEDPLEDADAQLDLLEPADDEIESDGETSDGEARAGAPR